MSEVHDARLEKLVQAVREHIVDMDQIMKGPSTFQRGQHFCGRHFCAVVE